MLTGLKACGLQLGMLGRSTGRVELGSRRGALLLLHMTGKGLF